MRTSIAIALAVVPALLMAQGTPPAWRDTTFQSAGVKIRYVDTGERETPQAPVILLHGYTGSAERHWTSLPIVADLAREHRVIAIDLRGHGRSDKPRLPSQYGVEMSRDVVRLMDHLGVPRAHLVGYSLGAAIAGNLLTTHAARFASAAFVGSGPWHRWTVADAEMAEAAARELEGEFPFRGIIVALHPADEPPLTTEQIRKASQSMVARNDVAALAAFHRGRVGLVVSDSDLAGIRTPTIGIVGGSDRNLGDMRELTRLMGGFDLVVVEGATHGGDRGILRTSEFRSALLRFLAPHPLGLRTAIYEIPDSQIARAKAWYTEVLGTKPYFDEPFYIGFNVGGFELGLNPTPNLPARRTEAGVAYWGVTDAKAAYARLLELGAREHQKLLDVGGGVWIGSVWDPFGNVLGVVQNPNFRVAPP